MPNDTSSARKILICLRMLFKLLSLIQSTKGQIEHLAAEILKELS